MNIQILRCEIIAAVSHMVKISVKEKIIYEGCYIVRQVLLETLVTR